VILGRYGYFFAIAVASHAVKRMPDGGGRKLVKRDDETRRRVPVRSTRVSLSNFVVLMLAVALAATGQVMLKHGMMRSAASAKEHGSSLAANAIGNGWVWLGLVPIPLS
jgi:hypothetical protein